MPKPQKLNPIDARIYALSQEFAKIPNFNTAMQDPDLKNIHEFVSAKLLGLYATRDLVLQTFMPAINRLTIDTKNYVRTSIYKHILDTIDLGIDDTKYETIRLGYVLTFHKYENFVKEFLELWEKYFPELREETGQTLIQYLKSKLNFNPKAWHESPFTHTMNFIANCTKHQDGKCKLDSPSHTKPFRYSHVLDSEILRPTVQEYKADCDRLFNSIPMLIQIISHGNLLRIQENNLVSTYEIDGEKKPLFSQESVKEMEPLIEKMTSALKNLVEVYKY